VTEPLVYLNGQFVPASQAHVAIFDAGVVFGATVTDQTRTFHLRPFRLTDHVDRLFRALRYTRLDIVNSPEELIGVSQELIAQNSRLVEKGDELGLVHFVTAGEYAAYASRPVRTGPTICAHTFELPFELWARKMQTGAHLVTPSIRHVPPQCLDPKMKCRSRMHYYLADKEARLVDPDASALLLDLDGNVTETSTANFLMVESGTIVSPTTRNTLPGVSRATVIDLAAELGIPFVERDIQVFSAVNADEAFLASTPYCLMPVTKINGVAVGDGAPGPVYRRLLHAWSRLVGLDIEQQILEGAARRQAVKGPHGIR
jgi:branched-subunit amino acid aminotransferase/4-amino-4-deoxychorismate lyase